MFNVKIIIGSTRNNRVGDKVGKLVVDLFKDFNDFEVELIDLRDWPLPFYNEDGAIFQLNGNYSDTIINKWQKTLSTADAYIIVTPEYNHGYPAVLKNAIDYAYNEWVKKPFMFVSYSVGAFGGVRAVEQLRQVIINFKSVPLNDALHLANIKSESFYQNGDYKEKEALKGIFQSIYKELLWWTKTLKYGRDNIK